MVVLWYGEQWKEFENLSVIVQVRDFSLAYIFGFLKKLLLTIPDSGVVNRNFSILKDRSS